MKSKYVIYFQFLFLVFASIIYSDRDCQIFENNYTGNGDTIIASSGEFKLSEKQFYSFLLIKGFNPVYLYDTYLKTPDKSRAKEIIRASLEREIKEFFLSKHLAKNLKASATPPTIDELHMKYTLYPIYKCEWISYFIKNPQKPKVKVLPEDIRKYYNENKNSKFLIPPRIHLRFIYKKSPQTETESERQKIKSQMLEAKQKSTSEDAFADFAKRLSDDPSGQNGGEIPVFAWGSMPSGFEEIAFGLQPGKMSDVVELSNGFYLIYCKEKFPSEPQPIDEVMTEIENELFLKFLKLQYDFEIELLNKKYRPKNEFNLWYALDENDPIIEVRNFKILKNEIRGLFPEIFMAEDKINMDLLGAKCGYIVEHEMIAQEMNKKKLRNLKGIAEGKTIVEDYLIAKNYIANNPKSNLAVSDGDIKNFYDENKNIFAGMSQKSYMEFWISISEPEKYDATKGASEAENLKSVAGKFALEISELIAKKTGTASDQISSASLAKIVLSLKEFEEKSLKPLMEKYKKKNKDMTLRYQIVENMTFDRNAQQGNPAALIAPGKYSKIFSENMASLYFVLSEDIGFGGNFDRIKPIVKERLIEKLRADDMEKYYEEIFSKFPIIFSFNNSQK